MLDMANKEILPAALSYVRDLSEALVAKKTAAPFAASRAEEALIARLSALTDCLFDRIAALETELADIRAALADGSLFRTDAARAQRLTGRLQPAEAELDAAVERWAELEERRG
jgi:glutamine synthetase type III